MTITHLMSNENAPYRDYQYIYCGQPNYISLIQENPELAKLHNEITNLIENSPFKGRVTLDIMIRKKKVVFFPDMESSYRNENRINAYKSCYSKLFNHICSQHVMLQ